MNKTIFILTLILFISHLSAIDVSGNQSGIWSPENNPYNVVGDITVPEGEILQIDPGVEVVVQGDFQITVAGQIEANGTDSDMIYFQSNSGGISWSGIRLENEILENTFEYCEIKNAENAVNSINSEVTIVNCDFFENEKAIHIYGIGNPRPVTIQNCYINGCQQNGIYIVENSNVQILNCEITQCALDESPRGSIMLSSQGSECSPLIRENYIHDNVWQGITAWDITGGGNINAEIKQNDISNNLTGIYLYYANGIVDSNYIHHNFVAGNPNSGAGIMVGGSSSTPIITNNDIFGNFCGFYIVEGASPNLGDLNNAFPGDDGNNRIYDNIDESQNTWSVYNMSSANIMAENNSWDSIEPEEIATTIFDGNDNPAYGIVDFEPIHQAMISGTVSYYGNYLVETVLILLYSFEWESVIDIGIYNIFEEFDHIVDAGDYYLYGFTMYDENNMIYGVYGGVLHPQIITVTVGSEITDLDFEIFDNAPIYQTSFQESYWENNTEISPYKDLKVPSSLSEEIDLYLEDNNVKIYGAKMYGYGGSGGNVEEIILDQEAIWCPVELTVGDSWTTAYVGRDNNFELEIVYSEADVITTQDVIIDEQEYEAFIVQALNENTQRNKKWFVEDIGIVKDKTYHYDIEGTPFLHFNFSVFDYEILNGNGFMPVYEDNAWVYSVFFNENPTDLIAIYNDDSVTITWDPPYSGIDPEEETVPWFGYYIYRNNELITPNPVQDIEFQVEAVPETEYYVTCLYNTGESEPSNTLIINFTNIEDNTIDLQKLTVSNFPNPFHSTKMGQNFSTEFNFYLPESGKVQLEIYNLKGQKVCNLLEESKESGSHSITWNGTDSSNKQVSSGIYFYRLSIAEKVIAKKMMLLK